MTLTVILGIAVTIIAIFAPTSFGSFKSAAAVLTFASGEAVAIERIIEALWTFVGGVVGTYWPLNVINNQVETMVADLDTALRPFHASLSEELAAVANQKSDMSA